jgi:hypothetical protein
MIKDGMVRRSLCDDVAETRGCWWWMVGGYGAEDYRIHLRRPANPCSPGLEEKKIVPQEL